MVRNQQFLSNLALPRSTHDDSWYFDNSASFHMTYDINNFEAPDQLKYMRIPLSFLFLLVSLHRHESISLFFPHIPPKREDGVFTEEILHEFPKDIGFRAGDPSRHAGGADGPRSTNCNIRLAFGSEKLFRVVQTLFRLSRCVSTIYR